MIFYISKAELGHLVPRERDPSMVDIIADDDLELGSAKELNSNYSPLLLPTSLIMLSHHSHLGSMRTLRASTIRSTVRSSTGTGSGPTPALTQAAPQKGWSPKKGTMNVGLPEGQRGAEGERFRDKAGFDCRFILGPTNESGSVGASNPKTLEPTAVQPACRCPCPPVVNHSTALLKQPVVRSLKRVRDGD